MKVPYKTRNEAKAAAEELSRKTFGRYHAYKCKHCRFFHIGHRKAFKPKKW